MARESRLRVEGEQESAVVVDQATSPQLEGLLASSTTYNRILVFRSILGA